MSVLSATPSATVEPAAAIRTRPAPPHPAAPAGAPRETSAARAVRAAVGVGSVVAGVGAAFVMAADLATGSPLPSELDALLPVPLVARVLFAALALGAVAGGICLLRRSAAGVPLVSGTWAVVAALAACPSVRFNYAEGAAPTIELPAAGSGTPAIAAFAVAALLVLFSRVLCRGAHAAPAEARRVNTAAEVLVAAFLLVSGASIAMSFAVEAARLGARAYEPILLPLLVATLLLQAIGMGVLGGWSVARAMAIALLLAVASGALDSDLVLDRVMVEQPAFWAPACVAGALGLLLPARKA